MKPTQERMKVTFKHIEIMTIAREGGIVGMNVSGRIASRLALAGFLTMKTEKLKPSEKLVWRLGLTDRSSEFWDALEEHERVPFMLCYDKPQPPSDLGDAALLKTLA